MSTHRVVVVGSGFGGLFATQALERAHVAWLLWLAIHLFYIIGFKHRLTTLLHWAVSFIGSGRSERVATEQQVLARVALGRVRRDPPTTGGAPPEQRPGISGGA